MNYQDLAVHTFTTKPWSLDECIEGYAKRGIGGISIWRETLEGEDLCSVSKHLDDAGLTGISLVRGGFFTGKTKAERDAALEENRQALREAAMLELPSLVLVCGATVGQTPWGNYLQIRDGIAALADEAEGLGVRLLVEPLHPIYAGDRSGISSLKVANNLCAELNHANVGIALDVYHVWWEHDLAEQIDRASQNGWLDTYHICDFKPDQSDILLDRGIMGEGCCQLAEIDRLMSEAGFDGFREVEIFSSKWWARDQDEFLDTILHSYDQIYRAKS
ncbi:MAG: sugar phosphate isomerase/epimerase family protein [Akkermansiaceae bacterium]|jgi:sugar phosphate isomerase/epimerase|nr:sugar phosphate isomerase/epimerase [Akkermansiaceae bacterium]|tara:strand:- start:1675 stop:2502 length:828 start_codon:yes stop_codon:yes gene_type:complete